MGAPFTSASCLPSSMRPDSRISFSRAAPIRSRISAAAASVNVTTNKRSISTGVFLSQTIRIIRSTSNAVLPAPAAAATSKLAPVAVIASSCSSVQALFTGVHSFFIG